MLNTGVETWWDCLSHNYIFMVKRFHFILSMAWDFMIALVNVGWFWMVFSSWSHMVWHFLLLNCMFFVYLDASFLYGCFKAFLCWKVGNHLDYMLMHELLSRCVSTLYCLVFASSWRSHGYFVRSECGINLVGFCVNGFASLWCFTSWTGREWRTCVLDPLSN